MNRRCLFFATFAALASAQAAFGQYDGGRAVRAAYRQAAPPAAVSLEDMPVPNKSRAPVVYQGQPDANFAQPTPMTDRASVSFAGLSIVISPDRMPSARSVFI